MAPQNKSNEIKIVRVYNAPVKAVWDAWTDVKKVAKWWGPRGFTITTHSKDLKPGGHWNYTMHGPDGVDYPNKTHYFEVEKCAKLVYDHGASDDTPPLFRVTALFSEINGKTKLDMTMAFPTPEVAEEMGKFIKQAGGDATWDRLAEYLEKDSSGRELFVINRSFDAPLDLMFKMWTDRDLCSKWQGPAGTEMHFIRHDIKPGGSVFYYMASGANPKIYGKAEYIKIEKPNLLVYTQHFCDESEKVSRHPLAPTWPEAMMTTVDFAEEGPDRTRVTVTWEPYGTVTREEMETFIEGKAGMTQGWTGSFDKLQNYLINQ